MKKKREENLSGCRIIKRKCSFHTFLLCIRTSSGLHSSFKIVTLHYYHYLFDQKFFFKHSFIQIQNTTIDFFFFASSLLEKEQIVTMTIIIIIMGLCSKNKENFFYSLICEEMLFILELLQLLFYLIYIVEQEEL